MGLRQGVRVLYYFRILTDSVEVPTPTTAYTEKLEEISEICVKLPTIYKNQNKHGDSKRFSENPWLGLVLFSQQATLDLDWIILTSHPTLSIL